MANSKGLSKAEAKSIFAKMERYTETEKTQFALAIQAAEEWQEILKDKDLFPNLEYRAVGDENTRESHQQLSGIIKPIEDAFWGKYYPPIDYRCRCSVRQHRADAKITKNLPEKLPKVAKGLDHNPGQTGQAFNFSHPYFENASKKTLTNVAEYSQYDKAYRKEYFDVKTGGYLVRHKKHVEQNWQKNVEASIILNKELGAKIELLKKERPDLVSPDAKYNGLKADFKHPKNPEILINFIRKAIKDAKKQGEIAVIYLPKNYSYKSLLKGFEKYLEYLEKDNAQIKTIILATEYNKVAIFNEQDFEDGKWTAKIEELKK